MNNLSLKYRIALVIFVLEAIMVLAVLWSTSGESFETAKNAQKQQEDIFIDVITELSVSALLTEEYGDVQYFFEKIVNKEDVSKAFLIDIAGNVVASSDVGLIGGAYPEVFNTTLLYWRKKNIDSAAGVLGELAIEFSNEALVRSNTKIRNRGVVVAAIGMSFILIVGVLVGFALTRRLDNLTVSAKKFADGDMSTRIKVSGGDELSLLGNTFNDMVESVAKSQALVSKEKEQFQLLLDSTAEAILGVDTESKCIFVNNACVHLLGYENSESLVGLTLDNILKIRSTSISAAIADEDHAGDSNFSEALRFDGASLPIEYWQHPIKNNDQITGAVITFFDITQSKQKELELAQYRNHLEKLVDERTNELKLQAAKLENTNKELTAFSYSVSHDLRSPLRSINGFCHLLAEDYSENLDEEGKEYLQRIAEGSTRMGVLIDDMLALSRISRQEMKKTEIDLTAVAKKIVTLLLEKEPDRHVEFHISEGLKVFGDEGFLTIALNNLLENAWKYSRNTEKAEIYFSSKKLDDKTVYYVKDNGIGFDMQYVNKIFGTFQRLHTKGEFEGTGVGLATVARIIHRHNGEIWAEAEVNKGATFYFTL